jgi:hypothetical protein
MVVRDAASVAADAVRRQCAPNARASPPTHDAAYGLRSRDSADNFRQRSNFTTIGRSRVGQRSAGQAAH